MTAPIHAILKECQNSKMRCIPGVLAPLAGVMLIAVHSGAFTPFQGPTALSSRPHHSNVVCGARYHDTDVL